MLEIINSDSYHSSNNNDFTFYNFNSKEIVLVDFFTFDEKLIIECEYRLSQKIEELIDDFLNKKSDNELKKLFDNGQYFNKNNFSYYFKRNDWFEKIDKSKILFNNISGLENKDYIESIQTTTQLVKNKIKIYVKNPRKYKYIAENIEEYIINNTKLIGKPIINEYECYLYDKVLKKIKKIKFHSEQIRKMKIKAFSGISSYCNANNSCYIYEGNTDLSNNNNNFYQINLTNVKINLISSNFPSRYLFSMIYIPKKYIFIVGGKKAKHVITYKIKDNNKKYDIYPFELPYEILEPSLITINDKYLYAFENSSLYFHILRTNFIQVEPFEDVEIKNNNYEINQKFFGVVKCNNSILFLGGQMLDLFENTSKKCFIYNYNKSTVERDIRDFKPFEFMEKTFIPLGKDIYFQTTIIRNQIRYEPKIILFKDELKNNKDNNSSSFA
jgi:hypothetical protein